MAFGIEEVDFLFETFDEENAKTFENYKTEIPQNVYFGITTENQERFNERMSALYGLGTSVFLSCEPLLGEIDISEYAAKIDWVIVGGENAPLLKCREFRIFSNQRGKGTTFMI